MTDEGNPDLALSHGYPQRNLTKTIALGTISPFNPNIVIGVLGDVPYAEIKQAPCGYNQKMPANKHPKEIFKNYVLEWRFLWLLSFRYRKDK